MPEPRPPSPRSLTRVAEPEAVAAEPEAVEPEPAVADAEPEAVAETVQEARRRHGDRGARRGRHHRVRPPRSTRPRPSRPSPRPPKSSADAGADEVTAASNEAEAGTETERGRDHRLTGGASPEQPGRPASAGRFDFFTESAPRSRIHVPRSGKSCGRTPRRKPPTGRFGWPVRLACEGWGPC